MPRREILVIRGHPRVVVGEVGLWRAVPRRSEQVQVVLPPGPHVGHLSDLVLGKQMMDEPQLGDARRFRTAVETAEDAHAAGDPASEPRWLRGFDTAELVGTIGSRYRDLARHDRRHARPAVDYLGRALEWRDPTRTRNRAFDLVSLGRAHLLIGEPGHAAATVSEALPHFDAQRPGRLGGKLAEWHRESAPFATVAAVADLREQTQASIGRN